MAELYEAMPQTLQRQVLVREQLAFALNRRAAAEKKPEDRDRALRLLEGVERDQGPSSETCGLAGRIYKDLWDESRGDQPALARGHLKKAIDAYVRGFDAQKEEYVDMFKAGIIDPTKVVRTALQLAASVAGLQITTECMVAEKPERKQPMMPGGGGMGGMGGMGDMGMM